MALAGGGRAGHNWGLAKLYSAEWGAQGQVRSGVEDKGGMEKDELTVSEAAVGGMAVWCVR